MTHAPTPADLAPLASAGSLTVVRAQGGDLAAREELASACHRQAYLFALQLLGRQDDAMDIAQEAMLRFFASLGRFDVSRPVRPWLLRIVRNLVRDRARRQRVRRTEPLRSDPADVVLEPADPGPDPEACSAQREVQLVLWAVLRELPSRQREVLALRDYMDLTYDEIATTLEIPRGTVMSRLHRARRHLRERVLKRLTRAREVQNA